MSQPAVVPQEVLVRGVVILDKFVQQLMDIVVVRIQEDHVLIWVNQDVRIILARRETPHYATIQQDNAVAIQQMN